MEYVIEYVVFLAKTATIVIAVFAILSMMVAAGQRNRRHMQRGSLHVTHVNKELESMQQGLQRSILDKFSLKRFNKAEKKRLKDEEKKLKTDSGETRRRRVYVLSFEGDMEASGLESLRQEVTAVLTMAEPQDEVMVRLESPGGMVHAYGLASSQLLRVRQREIPLTICVDKVAASGGYMMACVADRIIAAPFAILGSIGVLVQLPNIHRLLKKNDVDFEMITAGEYKRTLTPFSEVTEKGRDKVKQEVEEMHELFKQWVKQYRPVVDIDIIATGETWTGTQAQTRNMVDAISTSDDYIVDACKESDVYEVNYEIRVPLGEKLGGALQKAMDKTLLTWWQRLREQRQF
ncbi:MAG: protease SohB [Gammaproteobacteria bacterium]|nr:protease SohB [Gammaproteobacteria bacterium]